MLSPDRTIIHLTDTHILPTDEARLHGVDTTRTLRDALEVVAGGSVRPDAFIISGDLADKGEVAAYERLREVVEEITTQFDAPVILAMGNHDDRANMREGLLGVERSDEPYDHVAWVGGLRIVVLDSTVPGSHYGQFERAQLDWLTGELAMAAPEGTVLVMHHPPAPGPVPLLNSLILRNRDELAAALQGTDVLAVLSGHVHHPTTSLLAGIQVCAAPATAYTVDPLAQNGGFRGIEGPGFATVQLYGRQVVFSGISLPSSQRELYRYELDEATWRAMTEGGAQAPAMVEA